MAKVKYKTEKKFFSYSLRALLIIIVFINVGYFCYQKYQQKHLIAQTRRILRRYRGLKNYSTKELYKLTILDLSSWEIYNIDVELIKALQNLPKLRTLYLNRGDIEDKELLPLQQLRKLSVLKLNGTNITDKGLLHLSNIRNLTSLSLNNTKITDNALEHLKKLKNLSNLYLNRTEMSIKSLNELKKALPNCIIDW